MRMPKILARRHRIAVGGAVVAMLLAGPVVATSAAASPLSGQPITSINVQGGMVPEARGVVPSLTTIALPGGTATPATKSCSGANEAIIDEHHGSPLYSYVPGNGNVNLYFDNSGARTYFCGFAVSVGGDFVGYQFYVKGTSVCLALDASATSIHEGSATACSGLASYTMWNLITTSNSSYYLYQSQYNGDCIYDNTQRPVTYSGCSDSNQFEWLSIP
jgi:hypothetical protein